jgi:hypothetical protein
LPGRAISKASIAAAAARGRHDVRGALPEVVLPVVDRGRPAVDDDDVLAVGREVCDVGQRAPGVDRAGAADLHDDGHASHLRWRA